MIDMYKTTVDFKRHSQPIEEEKIKRFATVMHDDKRDFN